MTASTSNATPEEMLVDGSTRVTLSDNEALSFILLIDGYDATNDEACGYRFEGTIRRDSGAGTTTLVSSGKTVLAEDDASCDAAVSADTSNGSLKVEVTGPGTKSLSWRARISGSRKL